MPRPKNWLIEGPVPIREVSSSTTESVTAGNTPRRKRGGFRYPRGRWDVEAAFVDSTETVWLITKGRGRAPALYRLPAAAWGSGETVTAVEAGRLSLDTESLGNRVTDAALSPSGRVVAVRTYLAIYLFALTDEGTLAPTGIACDAAGLQIQGEGISWINDHVLVLTSEGSFGYRGTIVLLGCGDPDART
jgi:hypothetical protein